LVVSVGFLAAHEHGDAIMGAGDDELVPQWSQSRRTATTQAVSKHDGFDVRPCVNLVQVLLQSNA
jgi:hypothetical protein